MIFVLMKVKKAANVVITYINNITSAHRDKCVVYKLEEITDAMKSVANDKLLTFKISINDVIGMLLFDICYAPCVLGSWVLKPSLFILSPTPRAIITNQPKNKACVAVP